MQRLLVTGGAGFIGSNFIRYLLGRYPDCRIVNLDKLTYAGNLENLRDVENDDRYTFVKGDIADAGMADLLREHGIEAIVNFAAESHVDRSIMGPRSFIETDILGTHNLLEAARQTGVARYLQISTDEVYGSVDVGQFTEDSPLRPSSPYSASKAGADLLVLAYHRTYGMDLVITRSSNNYGPHQYPEKLIPLFITNLLEGKRVPLYGDGLNVRDWLHVLDNCAGIDAVLRRGAPGEVYNIGGDCERTNLEIARALLALLGKNEDMIEPVADRAGHDRRYALDCSKARALGWRTELDFETGLAETVAWYRDHPDWWRPLKSGEYEEYYRRQYLERRA
jgi:dTDP-glucose 4,6-dehydratase